MSRAWGLKSVAIRAPLHLMIESCDESISKPKTVEAALRDHQEFYRAVFEVNTALKLLLDPETGEIVDANSPACDFYGYSYSQLTSMRIHDINIANPNDLDQALVDCKLRSRSYFNMKHRLASGELREVDVYSGPISFNHRTLLFSIIHDVTDRKRLEDQLHQAQKMEAVGQLAGGVAHDFNNLLTALIGYGELIVAQAESGSKIKKNAEHIVRIAGRAEELTRQLLVFSRRQMLQPRVIDLNEVVRESSQLLQRVIGEDIRFGMELDAEAGSVHADPGQLELLIMNLVVNARDAMPTGGSLTIGTGRRCDGKRPEICLLVRDTGLGMTDEIRSHIFEPFFTTKEKSKGTGLGLATVYGIVQQSGGRIEVESKLGEGSLFTVFLPAAPAGGAGFHEDPKTAHSPCSRVRRGSRTVLVVEDEDDVRSILVESLSHRGYCVLEAESGEKALLLAAAHPGTIDALISDIKMSGMNGRELAEAIHLARPAIKTILISGYSDGLVDPRVLDRIGAVFLHKPFKGHVLADALAKALGDEPESAPSS